MPPGAADFAVGDRLQAALFLASDDALDLAVLDRLECRRIDFASGALLARLLQRGRTQQAADVIGAKRRRRALRHRVSSPYPLLPPLLVLGQDIAFFRGGEAALRRQAKLVEVDELGRLLNTALEFVLGFQPAALRGGEAEYDGLAL